MRSLYRFIKWCICTCNDNEVRVLARCYCCTNLPTHLFNADRLRFFDKRTIGRQLLVFDKNTSSSRPFKFTNGSHGIYRISVSAFRVTQNWNVYCICDLSACTDHFIKGKQAVIRLPNQRAMHSLSGRSRGKESTLFNCLCGKRIKSTRCNQVIMLLHQFSKYRACVLHFTSFLLLLKLDIPCKENIKIYFIYSTCESQKKPIEVLDIPIDFADSMFPAACPQSSSAFLYVYTELLLAFFG